MLYLNYLTWRSSLELLPKNFFTYYFNYFTWATKLNFNYWIICTIWSTSLLLFNWYYLTWTTSLKQLHQNYCSWTTLLEQPQLNNITCITSLAVLSLNFFNCHTPNSTSTQLKSWVWHENVFRPNKLWFLHHPHTNSMSSISKLLLTPF